ncbi:MAG: hypothetical protein APR54_02150 [Candidatus Cloacimonas sp. SDB]|nr:MAG: hypothetical protein APR54_02150 [Candidatus Cloacimonas sp. SDB]
MESIILSAGQSARMGINKALLEINGKRVLDILLAKLNLISTSIYIILGDNYAEVEKYLQTSKQMSKKIELIFNENHMKGMFTSVIKGFQQTSAQDYVLLQMIDQPFVGIELYEQLMKNVDDYNMIFQPASGSADSVKPGHPLIFSKEFKEVLLNNPGWKNLRNVIRACESQRKFYFTDDESIFMNLNTPEDVKKYQRRSGNGNTII